MLKRLKTKYTLIALPLILFAWLTVHFYPCTQQSETVAVFGGLVFVKNPPCCKEGKLAWWRANKVILMNKYHLIPDKGFFRVPIMNFGDGWEKQPHDNFIARVAEDDYVCDEARKDEKPCIKKETAFSIGGDLTNKVFIDVGDEEYIETPDGKTILVPDE